MRNILAIAGKELRQFFGGAVAYVVMTAFFMLTGFFFYDMIMSYNRYIGYAQMQPMYMQQLNINDMIVTPLFQNINVILLLIVPLITMRLFAEERNQGTDELLLTSPVSIGQIVTGKLLSALAFYALLLVMTFVYPAILAKYAMPDLGKLITGYVGLLLMGACFISFGLFASTLTRSQLVAAITSFAVLLVFWILGWIAESQPGIVGEVMRYLAMTEHFERFGQGVIELSDVTYFISFILFFWFLATRAVESTRWR
ncbi:MAG: ABC transporter permease subunit [Candidatus Lernaella stagnicola]|nr:ABC transporter permease subunit [Candidatus Lernaella stagnicola]